MICGLLLLVVPALADDVNTVETLLKDKTEAVLAILKAKDLGEETKKERIMEMIGPIIDFELMAKLTLGKTNWGRMDEKEQAEFVDLFVTRLKRSYLDKSTFYDDEKNHLQAGGAARQ